jgi:hypothetical protein
MINIICSRADVENYVANVNPAGVLSLHGDPVAKVTDRVLDGDHPDYGDDWTEWLEVNIERIARSATEHML